jgi:hypothetical protein
MTRHLAIIAGASTLLVGFGIVYDHFIGVTARASASSPLPATVRTDETASPGSASNAELAALKEGMARLSSEVSSLREKAAAARRSPATGRDPASQSAPRRDPEELARQDKERHEYMAGIQAAFRAEPTDTDWSTRTSSMLSDVFKADGTMSGTLRNVECRSQTCRVELSDTPAGTLRKDLMPLLIRIGQALPKIEADYVDDGTGQQTTVLYMTRGNVAAASKPGASPS